MLTNTKTNKKYVIICDIDGTLIYSPYQCPFFLKLDLQIQHDLCSSPRFRQYLRNAKVLDWTKTFGYLFRNAERVIFLTGRSEYQEQITIDFLVKNFQFLLKKYNGLEVKFVNYKNFNQMFRDKYKFIKDLLEQYELVILFDDIEEFLDKIDIDNVIKVHIKSNICKQKYRVVIKFRKN